jgi:lipid-binding SYLF domain-containing protein
MRSRQLQACLAVAVLLFAIPTFAASKEEQRVADAADVLDQLLRIPEQSIPPAMLSRAYAVAVVPSVVRIGFGLGARRGKGILVVRQQDGSWSNPAFITLTGGSFGFQAGVQRTDVVLVFKSRRGVDNITNGKLTLGADASIAAGPVGRSVEGATDMRFEAEIVSYSRARGIFAGVSFAGSGVTMDRRANAAYYGSPSITPEKIFASSPPCRHRLRFQRARPNPACRPSACRPPGKRTIPEIRAIPGTIRTTEHAPYSSFRRSSSSRISWRSRRVSDSGCDSTSTMGALLESDGTRSGGSP